MDQLNVVRVEDGYVVVANSDGIEFSVVIDDVTIGRLKRHTPADSSHTVSPREIQTHLRSGLSRDEVAALTGVTADEVERFEGPVLAELEYVVSAALALPAPQTEGSSDEKSVTIGVRVQGQIERLGGSAPVWSSWRNVEGDWHLKCVYTVHERETEARWTFDPKHHVLTPLDDEAASLMSVEVYSSGVIPRLRAVKPQRRKTEPVERISESDVAASADPPPHVADTSDTQALDLPQEPGVSELAPVEPTEEQQEFDLEELADATPSPTADLLAALRKRRNESSNAPAWLAEAAAETGSVKPSITDELNELQDNPPPKPTRNGGSRRHRAEMPTWDEIVFGTKVEDDLI